MAGSYYLSHRDEGYCKEAKRVDWEEGRKEGREGERDEGLGKKTKTKK